MLVLQIVLRLTTWLPIASNMQVEQGMAIGRFLLQRLTQPHTLNRDIGIISFISGLERSSFERLDGLGMSIASDEKFIILGKTRWRRYENSSNYIPRGLLLQIRWCWERVADWWNGRASTHATNGHRQVSSSILLQRPKQRRPELTSSTMRINTNHRLKM